MNRLIQVRTGSSRSCSSRRGSGIVVCTLIYPSICARDITTSKGIVISMV